VSVAVVIIAALAVVGVVFLVGAVKIVRPYQRGLVERLGRYKTTKEPGFNLIVPFIETMQLIDMREQVVDVPPQEVITEDNVVVSVDAVVYYEATDPQRLVYNVADFFTAITKLAQTNLRNLIGDLELDKALTSRDTINTQLREVLDDATDKWGVRVVRVEIQRIDPPPEVVSAMHAQMRAERDRRATVTEAKGYEEAAIARANGEKESSILAAEGRKRAAILDAEGDAQAIELRAVAEQLRLEKIGHGEGAAAHARLTGIKSAEADSNVLTIEYLRALTRIGDGRATKLIIPTELSGLVGTVAALVETVTQGNGQDGEIHPGGGLPAPDPADRVELPSPPSPPADQGGDR
jgi:regulator of protease activity HflC (stomatin/prohibitin superfamily)